LSQFDSRRLAGIHHRQAVHQETQKLGCRLVSPGGTRLHRQAIPQRNPENTKTGIRRLKAMSNPPGSFWKFLETRKLVMAEGNHTYIQYIHHAFNQNT